jgi:hypothetical protein
VDDQAAVHSFLGLDNTPAYLVKLRPVLKVDGVVKAAGSTPVQMGGFHSFTVEIQTPRGAVPVVNSMLAGGYYALGLATQPAAYEIPLARAPDDTEHPAADRLYAIAIDYIRRWSDAEQTLERLLRVVDVRPVLSLAIVGTAHARTVVSNGAACSSTPICASPNRCRPARTKRGRESSCACRGWWDRCSKPTCCG